MKNLLDSICRLLDRAEPIDLAGLFLAVALGSAIIICAVRVPIPGY